MKLLYLYIVVVGSLGENKLYKYVEAEILDENALGAGSVGDDVNGWLYNEVN